MRRKLYYLTAGLAATLLLAAACSSDDPVKLNLPNPGLANCTAIPGMKIITIGGDAGPEIKYRKKLKIIPAAGTVIISGFMNPYLLHLLKQV